MSRPTDVFARGVIAAMFVAPAWAWNQVPERIPVHWNAAGEVDGYGGRFLGLLLMPLVALGVQVLFIVRDSPANGTSATVPELMSGS